MFASSVLVFAQNVTVATQDPRMLFDGSWVAQDSGGYEYTTTIGSSVSLTFSGKSPFHLNNLQLQNTNADGRHSSILACYY